MIPLSQFFQQSSNDRIFSENRPPAEIARQDLPEGSRLPKIMHLLHKGPVASIRLITTGRWFDPPRIVPHIALEDVCNADEGRT